MQRVLEKFMIKQGHCYVANLNPTYKSKPGKVRPVVVVQCNDVMDQAEPGIVVVPLTSKVKDPNIMRVALIPSAHLRIKSPSDVLINQILTLDRSLFLEELGPVDTEDFNKIQIGLKFLLGLDRLPPPRH